MLQKYYKKRIDKIINNKIIRNRPIWEYVKWQWDIDVIKSINKIIKILNISMALI